MEKKLYRRAACGKGNGCTPCIPRSGPGKGGSEKLLHRQLHEKRKEEQL